MLTSLFQLPSEKASVSLTWSPLEVGLLYGVASLISDPRFRRLNTLKLTEGAEQMEPMLLLEVHSSHTLEALLGEF